MREKLAGKTGIQGNKTQEGEEDKKTITEEHCEEEDKLTSTENYEVSQ